MTHPDPSRRRFLATLLTLPCALVVRSAIAAAPRLTLYGDGIHDDYAALQARIDACVRSGTPFVLTGGTYRLSQPLDCSGLHACIIHRNYFVCGAHYS